MFISIARRASTLTALAVMPVLALAACGNSPTAAPQTTTKPGALKVVTAFYPLQFAAETVGGDGVTVENLTAPGAEPHDLELTPQQVADIKSADVVIYLKGFQAAIDDAVAQEAGDRALDAGEGLNTLSATSGQVEEAQEEGATPPSKDPHVWLDPANMQTIVNRVNTALARADAANATTFSSNAKELDAQLGELDQSWKARTGTCANRDLVVSHEAFGYLAKRYAFTQVGISGLSPDAEPSAKKIADVSRFVRDNSVTTIYYETLVDPKVAQTVASETGAKTAVLDPLEGLVNGSAENYLTVMKSNLQAVVTGQGCT